MAQTIPKTISNEASPNTFSQGEDLFFQDIYILVDHGIGIEDVEILRSIGINTIKGFQMNTKQKLLDSKVLPEAKITKIEEICAKLSDTTTFITGWEVNLQRKQVFKLSTGSTNLDKLLNGGIESMGVTEIFGEARTGKTQIVHTLCVTAQMPGPGDYPGGKVLYIDTENTFRPERIRQISDRFDLEWSIVLNNILYARAYNSEHQMELIKRVSAKFHEEAGVFKLLVIDSIIPLFRVDFSGKNSLIDRQLKLAQMMQTLQKISEEYNVAVLITNQITTDLTISALGDNLPKPTGGNIMAHASTTRIALKRTCLGRRIATVYNSPNLQESEAEFEIALAGIQDPTP